MAAARAVRAVAALLSADDLQDVEDLRSPKHAAVQSPQLESLQHAVREAESRAQNQELAMQEERAEAKAEIAELEEQLKRLSAVEGAWADQVAQGEELHLENMELQRLVSKLHGDLFQSQSLNSQWQLAARATARKVAEKLLEFQPWSLHELKLCFLTWRLRTAARCAELAERARLRMQHIGRIEAHGESKLFE